MKISGSRQAVCLQTGTSSLRRADVQQGCCSSEVLQGFVMLTASVRDCAALLRVAVTSYCSLEKQTVTGML